MAERVGFIGLGIMGSRMAANLVRAGFDLTVWNRTRATADAWAERHRARVADSPADLASDSDVVITMVVDDAQVRSVLLDGLDPVAAGAHEGLLCVDMSTIAPTTSRLLAAELATHGVAFLDAPVTGSSPKAEDGTLTIMVGGDEADFERARPLFEAMGELIVHVGGVGQGEMLKLINNSVAAVNAAVVAEALIVARKTDVDLDALERVMGAGSGASAMLSLKAGPMRTHDFTTLFKLEHMLKDIRLCLEEGQRAGVPFTFAGYARELYTAGKGRGHGDDDFAAVVEVLEDLAGIRL
jgi:3-hydroxyisobutyrate dehydrogenase-like beta-hydroxyacid dehydrogenase